MVCWRGIVVWGGSVVLTGSFGGMLSWRVGSGLFRGYGLGGWVCFLRGRSGEADGAGGALFWVVLVGFVNVVLRGRGFLTIP